MKIPSVGAIVLAGAAIFAVAGCSSGKPGFRAETMRPDQQLNFSILYKQNCSGCHGDHGMYGAALPLNNPVYLTWAGHDRILNIIANGVPHTLMPAFSYGGGGLVTNKQIEVIVNGMMSHWNKPGVLTGTNVPGYTPAGKGDVAQGQTAFRFYCARCHGTDGMGLSPGGFRSTRNAAAAKPESAVGSIVNPTYLALMSDQGLRDIVVAGMPSENMPDWRNDAPGKPMTDKEVTDIVAWLISHRVQFPGRPFPQTQQQSAPQSSQRTGGKG